MSDEIPEPDRAPGADHPRETQCLIGQEEAERRFLEAFNSDRLHHAWLIQGPKGVGKATLAWRIAKFLLATPKDDGGLFGAPQMPENLDIAPDHPVVPRLLALSEPRLFVLRRPYDQKTERLKADITVDEVRKLKGYFSMSATDGGARVVIVDAADDMNVNAANALLKLLEEPPANTYLLLVTHQPTRLLPTIRSRCRTLRCNTLSAVDIATVLTNTGAELSENADAIASLASGSPGAALRLINMGGFELYSQLVSLLINGLDRPAALRFADGMTGRNNAEKFDLALELLDLFLARLARSGVSGLPNAEAAQNESALFSKLAPSVHHARKWADLQQKISARARHGQSVNLDPAALILDILFKINETAAELAA